MSHACMNAHMPACMHFMPNQSCPLTNTHPPMASSRTWPPWTPCCLSAVPASYNMCVHAWMHVFCPSCSFRVTDIGHFLPTTRLSYNRQVDLGMAMAHSRQQAIDSDHFLSYVQLLCAPARGRSGYGQGTFQTTGQKSGGCRRLVQDVWD